MADRDFVSIMNDLTNFIANERNSAANERIDWMLGNVRLWMRDKGYEPKGTCLPDLLDEIEMHIRAEIHVSA